MVPLLLLVAAAISRNSAAEVADGVSEAWMLGGQPLGALSFAEHEAAAPPTPCPTESDPARLLFMVERDTHEIAVSDCEAPFAVDGVSQATVAPVVLGSGVAAIAVAGSGNAGRGDSNGDINGGDGGEVGVGACEAVAAAALAAAGGDTQALDGGPNAGALAAALGEAVTRRREAVLDRCRTLHFVHGGLGLRGGEDVVSLQGDRCCDEVAQELLLFFRGETG